MLKPVSVATVLLFLVCTEATSGISYGYPTRSGTNGCTNWAYVSGTQHSGLTRQHGLTLLIPPSSTGLVCVLFPGPYKFNQTGTIYSISDSSLETTIGVTLLSQTTTADNQSLVIYRLDTLANSTGAYDWYLPSSCPGFPIVVGAGVSDFRPLLIDYYARVRHCIQNGPIFVIGTSKVSVENFAVSPCDPGQIMKVFQRPWCPG